MINIQNVDDLEVGDIAVYTIKKGSIETHRVIAIKKIDGKKVYLFQGTANNIPDTEWIPQDNILGIYQLKIHNLVRIVNILRSPFLIIIIISLLLINKLAKIAKRKIIK